MKETLNQLIDVFKAQGLCIDEDTASLEIIAGRQDRQGIVRKRIIFTCDALLIEDNSKS